MHAYRNAFPADAPSSRPSTLESLRAVANAASRRLLRNPFVAVANEMDRLTAEITDQDRQSIEPERIARHLRGQAYRMAVAGLIRSFGKIGRL
ncbi:hypothetical protein [Pacificispira sp.]|uniref:hypothetical protein n=1 Tax=Pacificispira sp. TaxID=2888761 RepID=UPI003B52C5DE